MIEMPVDIDTFRRYGKITQYVLDKHDGNITIEKLKELIGVEFDLLGIMSIERHYRNMILANFVVATVSGVRATKIDWFEFEEKIKKKNLDYAERKEV